MLDQFVVHELQSVFAMDALNSSHQISVDVNNPEEINDIFDKISYGKGKSLLKSIATNYFKLTYRCHNHKDDGTFLDFSRF